jgi:hypothetical protein
MNHPIKTLFSIAATTLLVSCNQTATETAKPSETASVSASVAMSPSSQTSTAPSASPSGMAASPDSSAKTFTSPSVLPSGMTASSAPPAQAPTAAAIPPALKASADEAMAVVKANLAAVDTENVQASMAEMHPDSPGYKPTEEMAKKLAQAYDLHCTLQDVAIVSITEDEAKVHFLQTSKKVSGPAYRNNRIEGIHTLKKYQGKWKMYDTQTIKLEYLDQ